MANEKRLFDANKLKDLIVRRSDNFTSTWTSSAVLLAVESQPTVDAVEVVQIEEVKREILQTLDTLIATHREVSNSQFSNYEKHLDIPKSSNDFYGIYADTMEIARRLVNAALTDLCSTGGAKMDGDGNG